MEALVAAFAVLAFAGLLSVDRATTGFYVGTSEDLPLRPGHAQYTSAEFTALLAEHRITQSLSRPRQCWDNAVAESFFASLKTEMINRQSWAARAQVRRAVFHYIEVFFNRQRLHSSLGYLTPVEYEESIHRHTAALTS